MKTRNLGLAATLVACLAAMGGIGCKKEPVIPAVVSVAVTPATCSVAVGATTVLHAQAYDANNVALSDAVTWSSSDTSKATVDASGIVTGVSTGNATITASVGSIHSNAVAVTVIAAAPHIAAIAITLDHSSIAVAANANATAIATDQYGATMVGVTFTWHSSNSAVATINDTGVATGVAAGTANITASSSSVTSAVATVTVTAIPASNFTLLPASIKLKVGGQAPLLAVTPSATPTWVSSDPAVATVDSMGAITAVAKGTAVITATSGSAVATSNIKVYQTSGAHPDPSSEVLIAQAVAGGMITHEQELEYRVFAQFGDSRLPAQYDGAPGGEPDHQLLRQVQAELPGLSVSAQDTLNPFLLAPIYTQSALNPNSAGMKDRVAIAPHSLARSVSVHALAGSGINCNVAAGPSAYRRVSVTTTDNRFTFNFFYFPAGGGLDPDLPQQHVVERIAAAALDVYNKETVLFQRFPLPDAGLPCNGGDAAIDFYLTQIHNTNLAGQTVPYTATCSNTPTFVELNLLHPIFFVGMVSQDPAEAASAIKSVIAHEFLHVLQFAMDRPSRCDADKWFDEATAQWAMDFVEPTFPIHSMGAPGMEDGPLNRVSTRKQRSGAVLAEYLYRGHLRPIEKGEPLNFGYADYLFFQYIAHTQNDAAIARIYDAMAGGMTNLDAIDHAIDSKAVWPGFSKWLWNDVDEHVLDYWEIEDDYDFGLADVFADTGLLDGAPSDLKPLEIDQKGKPDETFTLLDNALTRSASGDYEIPPRSLIYEQLKFTDPTVHTVTFTNPIADDPNAQFMKLWVVRKVGGHWQAPEDWTDKPIKAFCLDAKDERLEQLLVIVSNSEFRNGTLTPYRISLRAPMQVATTNVGCWHWEGTIGVTTHTPDGLVINETADVSFDPAKSIAAGLPDAGLSLGYLVLGTNATSVAHYNISGFSTSLNASVSGVANATMIPRANGPFVETDGSLILNFGLPDPMHRTVVGSGITHMTDVRITYTFPLSTETDSVDIDAHWLKFPDPLPTLSADGQFISGSFTSVDGEGTKVSGWDLHATREQ